MAKGIPINGINKGWFKKGHIPLAPFKKGQTGYWKGKINVFVKGHTTWVGKKHSEETKLKMSLASKGKSKPWLLGEKNHKWQGGITPINKAIRESLEYEEWRKKVFERDLYTCQDCGQVGGYLEADHIKPFSLFPELRFELSNGRTLCKPCHKKLGWELSRKGLRNESGRLLGKENLIRGY